VGEKLEAMWAKMFEVKDCEAIGRIVGGSDGEFHHVGGERGKICVQGVLSHDSTHKVAGGWVLGVWSNGGEWFAKGGGNLALRRDGSLTKLNWLSGWRVAKLSG
jgi:hypothetical protein